MPIKVLLQTTIPTPADGDDWGIARFAMLADFLRAQRDAAGAPLFDVTARDRDPLPAPGRVLSTLDTSDYDEAWLFAVDTGDGLTTDDCAAVSRFRRSGRGLLVTRDHTTSPTITGTLRPARRASSTSRRGPGCAMIPPGWRRRTAMS